MIGWLAPALISSTALMLAVLVARDTVARLFGPKAAYALWLLPALRLLLPPLPGWHSPIAGLSQDMAAPLAIRPDPVVAGVGSVSLSAPGPAIADAVASSWSILTYAPMLLLALWLGGAAMWFGWQLLRYRHFLRRSLRGAHSLGCERGIEILLGEELDGPLAAGVVRRRILLPADFATRYSTEEQRLALLHEQAHHDRHDLAANLVGLAVLALHWWNPIAHRAYRAFRADQELACDATVLAQAGSDDRLAYGTALLKSARGTAPAVACSLHHKAQLKRRIGMMQFHPVSGMRRLLGSTVATAIISGGLLLTATGAVSAHVERLALAAVPPVPPVPPVRPLPAVAPIPPVPPAPAIAAAPAAPPAPPAPPAALAPERMSNHSDAGQDEGSDARRAAHEAAREAREAARAAQEQAREAAAEAREQAHAAAAEARRAAIEQGRAERERAIAEAHAAIARIDVAKIVRTSMEATRANMAARCAATGAHVDAHADWSTLATCGKLRDTIRTSLAHARASIAATHGLDDCKRTKAISAIDDAMENLDRDMDAADPHPSLM